MNAERYLYYCFAKLFLVSFYAQGYGETFDKKPSCVLLLIVQLVSKVKCEIYLILVILNIEVRSLLIRKRHCNV